MNQIVFTDEQARMFSELTPPCLVVDSKGKTLGQITPVDPEALVRSMMSPERWEELQRRMREPGEYTTLDEIKKRLGW